MDDDSRELNEVRRFPPGFWRDASRLLNLYGIPAPLFLFYLAVFRFPSWTTFYIVTAIIIGFRLLSYFGWTLTVLISRLIFIVRGNKLAGRPWWYRRFTEKD
ncbi:IcmT/TraK family protein [Pseudomonas syringae pv. syringae]|uniref:IcmT/TraK family protein n=1 Tax=Pseudomonas syringae TaxID=317 RepID=UPI00200B3217|nr:IcmT/TraK family protein [Pseudomonas syringae]MCK9759920.1 IcmT/TraK family protein [Pseudomonas syringae pv. syringae]MCK9774911.1 IcmT/TraK family protein [Pseudomonas syringae pv. syringae]